VAEVAEATSVTSALCSGYLRQQLPELEVENFFTATEINELKHS
jgi:hypothetical protein